MLDPPVLTVTVKPGAWVDPQAMTRAIHDAGFTPVPEDVRLVLAGTLEERQGAFVLVLAAMKAPREVTCVAPSGSSGEAVAQALHGKAGSAVTIDGRWIFDGAGRLEVREITDGI
ncbi:MAG TPA: hypothetical protein VGS03_18820 [Candidatus Polarisedimenticolia bacterium]|jgi:hypothetical protein|nr:hypothetical protein [Candidatus Polarisedimenticolia bacterium]